MDAVDKAAGVIIVRLKIHRAVSLLSIRHHGVIFKNGEIYYMCAGLYND